MTVYRTLIYYQTITDFIHVLPQVHLYSEIRILQDYKSSNWYVASVAERTQALIYLPWSAGVTLNSDPVEKWLPGSIFNGLRVDFQR